MRRIPSGVWRIRAASDRARGRESRLVSRLRLSPDSVSGAVGLAAARRAARRARARGAGFFKFQPVILFTALYIFHKTKCETKCQMTKREPLCVRCACLLSTTLPRDLTNPHTRLTTARGQWARACAPIGRPAGVLAGASPVACIGHAPIKERRGSPKRSPHPPARPASPYLPCFLQSEGRRLAPLAKGGRSGSLALFACMAAAECALLLHTHTQAHTRARTTMRAHTHLGLI